MRRRRARNEPPSQRWRKTVADFDVGGFFAQVFAPEAFDRWQPPPTVDPSIATMQLRLRALGLYHGLIDGKPTDALRASLARFQRAAGLRASGDVHDPATRLALRDAVRDAAAAGARPAGGGSWPR
jgi:peptidoglycan hydrolase-like protein with peptidoglycan-binding domain